MPHTCIVVKRENKQPENTIIIKGYKYKRLHFQSYVLSLAILIV